MDHDAKDNGTSSPPPASKELALARLRTDEVFITQLLKALKGIAKLHLTRKGGLGRCDAGDMAADAIIAIFNGCWTWDPRDGKRTSFGLSSWSDEMHSFCYRCCAIIWSRVDQEYQKSKRQESGEEDTWQEAASTGSAESTSAIGNPWTDTPVEVLVCQENWIEVQALLPKSHTPAEELLLKVADQIAHSSPIRQASPTFSVQDILDPASLAHQLEVATAGLSQYLWVRFSPETHLLANANATSTPNLIAEALVTELNLVINGPLLDNPDLLREVRLSKWAQTLIEVNSQDDEQFCRRRLVLECAFPKHLSRRLHTLYEEGFARRKTGWACREIAAILGLPETAIRNAKRQLETILAPWLWSRFTETLPQDGRPWLALVSEAERPILPTDWKSTFAKTHSLSLGEVVEMGQEVLARFQKWFDLLHRTVKTEKQMPRPHSPASEGNATHPLHADHVPPGRALERRLNRFKNNIQESEQI